MACSRGRLNQLQAEFLERWFALERGFFLTGGGVLVGFLGAPRVTGDLDLFTALEEPFETGPGRVAQVCQELGAGVEELRTTPAFRRYRVVRGAERTLVDLVLDSVPQLFAKEERDGALLDPPEEILVNKICAMVGRGEPRDFVDVCYLCGLGHDRGEAVARASQKDGGVDESTLLYVLQDMRWDIFQARDVDPSLVESTRAFFRDWTHELALRLFPGDR